MRLKPIILIFPILLFFMGCHTVIRTCYLTGDFTLWNENAIYMEKEKDNEIFTSSFQFKIPGKYVYQFIINYGETKKGKSLARHIPDPMNPNRYTNEDGTVFSVIYVSNSGPVLFELNAKTVTNLEDLYIENN